MKQSMNYEMIELTELELIQTQGGFGPIGEALEWYYKTMGSFYHGVWDGLTGQEAKIK